MFLQLQYAQPEQGSARIIIVIANLKYVTESTTAGMAVMK